MSFPSDDSGFAPSDQATLCAFPNYVNCFDVTSAPYNAAGDGVTDDTAAIESAIAAAIAGGGHAFIYFPTGTYAVCRQTDTHNADLYQPIFDLGLSGRDASNLCFIGDGPALSIIKGYMPSLGDPVTAYQTSTLGSPNPQMSRFILFYNFSGAVSNLQFRSLMMDGQAGYTGDFTVGGSQKFTTFTISAAGSGYQVNDILTLTGQSPVANFPTETAQWKVTAIDGSGGVTAATLQQAGRYNSIASSAYGVTGGHGTGATFTKSATSLTGDGWDQLHKCLYLRLCDDVLIYNCELKNWKGEVIFGDGNGAVSVVGTASTKRKIRSTNSSAISIGANLLVSDMEIGGTGTSSDLVYNGTENFAFTAGQQTVCRRVSSRCDALGNAFVHLGVSGTTGLYDDCDVYGRFLLSETAHGITIQDSRFYNFGITTSNLGLYPESSQGFHNFTITGNTCTLDTGFTVNFYSAQNGVSDGLVISDNTLTLTDGVLNLVGGDFFQTGAVLTGNTLNGGATDIPNDFGDTQIGLWTGTVRPSGIGSMGQGVSTSGNGDTTTMLPLTDAVKLQSGNTNPHFIEFDDTLMDRLPAGFITKFRLGQVGTRFYLKKNALTNTFPVNILVSPNDTPISLNNSGLFEVTMSLLTNLAAYYPFENMTDASGNGHTLTNSGTGTFSAMKISNGFNVASASTQYATDSGNAILTGSKSALTFAGWLKRSGADKMVTVGYYDTNGERCSLNWYTDGNIYAFTGNGGDKFWTFADSSTGTHHFALVFDGSQSTNANRLKIYLDGVLLTGGSQTGSFPASYTVTGDFTFGHIAGGGLYSDGSYDEWGVWDRALSAAEITGLYNGNSGLAYPFGPTAGTLSATSHTSTTASLSYATVTGGTAPYSNQLRVSTTSGSGYSDTGSPVVGATASLSATGLTPATDYYFVVVSTDANSQTATSNEVHITTDAAASGPAVRPLALQLSIGL